MTTAGECRSKKEIKSAPDTERKTKQFFSPSEIDTRIPDGKFQRAYMFIGKEGGPDSARIYWGNLK
jgi:hypothetical protein